MVTDETPPFSYPLKRQCGGSGGSGFPWFIDLVAGPLAWKLKCKLWPFAHRGSMVPTLLCARLTPENTRNSRREEGQPVEISWTQPSRKEAVLTSRWLLILPAPFQVSSLLGGPGERWKVQTQTCHCPLGHPGLTFQLVGLLSLWWAQPALLHPEGCCPPGEGHFGPYLRDSARAVNEGATVGQVSGLGLCPFGCYVHASGGQPTQGL